MGVVDLSSSFFVLVFSAVGSVKVPQSRYPATRKVCGQQTITYGRHSGSVTSHQFQIKFAGNCYGHYVCLQCGSGQIVMLWVNHRVNNNPSACQYIYKGRTIAVKQAHMCSCYHVCSVGPIKRKKLNGRLLEFMELFYTCVKDNQIFNLTHTDVHSTTKGLLKSPRYPSIDSMTSLSCVISSKGNVNLWIVHVSLEDEQDFETLCMRSSEGLSVCAKNMSMIIPRTTSNLPEPLMTSTKICLELNVTQGHSIMGKVAILFEGAKSNSVNITCRQPSAIAEDDTCSTVPTTQRITTKLPTYSTTSVERLESTVTPITSYSSVITRTRTESASSFRTRESTLTKSLTSNGKHLPTAPTNNYSFVSTPTSIIFTSTIAPLFNNSGQSMSPVEAPLIAGGVGTAVGVITVLSVIITCLVYRRRRRSTSAEKETELADNPIYEGGPREHSSLDEQVTNQSTYQVLNKDIYVQLDRNTVDIKANCNDQLTYQSTYQVLNKDIYTQLDRNTVDTKANCKGPGGVNGDKNSNHLSPTYEAFQLTDGFNEDSQTPKKSVDSSEYTQLNFAHEDNSGSINEQSNSMYSDLESDKERKIKIFYSGNRDVTTENDYFVLETHSDQISGLNETETEPVYFEMEKEGTEKETGNHYFVSDKEDNRDVSSDPTYFELEQNQAAISSPKPDENDYFVLESDNPHVR